MLSTGDYYWNSGIFLWTVQTLHRHLAHLLPELLEGLNLAISEWREAQRRGDIEQAFPDPAG